MEVALLEGEVGGLVVGREGAVCLGVEEGVSDDVGIIGAGAMYGTHSISGCYALKLHRLLLFAGVNIRKSSKFSQSPDEISLSWLKM